MKRFPIFLLTVLASGSIAQAATSPALSDSIKTIRAVGPEGKGNAEATAAWKKLAAAEASP